MKNTHARIVLLLTVFLMAALPRPCTAQSTPTFTLDLNPVEKNGSPAWWQEWRPINNTHVSFQAKLSGYTDKLTSTACVFTLEQVSEYTGYCMNYPHWRTHRV